jgi:Tfp pilus assembly protein PilZ
MSDHRKEPRKKLIAFTPVYDSKTRVLLGYAGNLTLLGVMVIGKKPMEINKEILLTIEFPNNLPDVITAHTTIPARAAWCKPDESPQYFNIGFEFTEVTPQHTQIFEAILERYQFRQDQPDTD